MSNDIVAQYLRSEEQIKQGVDVAGALYRHQPGATVLAFEGMLEHQYITPGEVNRTFAQVHLGEILAPLSFKLFRERRVDHTTILVEEFHPCRMFFPNLDKGDDGIGAGLFEQCNGTVNILRTAQRCRGLQGEDGVVVLAAGFELSHHVLQHRNGRRIVAGQFGGRRKGTSRPQARPTSAISSSSVESTVRVRRRAASAACAV